MNDKPPAIARLAVLIVLLALTWLAVYGFGNLCYHVIIWVGT